MASRPHGDEPKINWFLVVFCTIVGIVIVGVGWLIDRQANSTSDDEFWVNVLINVGTSLLLAAALFFVEQKLLITNRRMFDEIVRPVENRVKNLERDYSSLYKKKHESDLGKFLGLSDKSSYEDFVGTFRICHSRKLISPKGIIVPAGPPIHGPRIEFSYKRAHEFDRVIQDEEIVVGLAIDDINPDWYPSTIWKPGSSLAMAILELHTKAEEAGYWKQAENIKMDIAIANLSHTLAEVHQSRSSEANQSWQSGKPVREVISDEWIITEEGVEAKNHGVVITAKAIKFRFRGETDTWRIYYQAEGQIIPKKPEWADEDLWNYALSRAKVLYPAHGEAHTPD